ncbi:helix-turn-helix transcriptional regulator [Aquimarina sp. 2201CG5-10]|uniref:helix-turn-helix domain-containing protein n=1 Tax=Aquimarina callyspongiae TaxID=3098150 RepID=UPI002AB51738|nr:helix-turn-helix transcriptional regulator [Aquimarina sp. 2201CG5-10]MDY8136336.1 helix-turn-helix transcriptional regulator [Aquimarina sp. 2201CG5-10]
MSIDKLSVSLGEKISRERKNKGLSQESLAEISNVSLRTIQRIEKGTVNPRPFTLKTIAESLDLTANELISDNSNNLKLIDEIAILKRMNLSTLGLIILPLSNIIFPIIIWKRNKKLQQLNIIGGKIVSLQILWAILTFIVFFSIPILLKIFTNNVGMGKFLSPLAYLISSFINIAITLKTTTQLNKKKTTVLSFVPNLF